MLLDVCLTPATIEAFNLASYDCVVVTDVFRATSCIVYALDQGVDHIIPFEEVEDCRKMQAKGYVLAGERGGAPLVGFELGNSPLSYAEQAYAGRSIAMTTTNGTRAIKKVESIPVVLIGAMINLKAIAKQIEHYTSTLVLCAGWQNRPNIEDTAFAGGLVTLFPDSHHTGDEAIMALNTYETVHNNPQIIKQASHYQRLKNLNVEQDLSFCLRKSITDVIPKYDKVTGLIR